jgi:hypothetical protein
MKKKINLSSVLFFLLAVAYFVASAKGLSPGHGTGQLGKGFFSGG